MPKPIPPPASSPRPHADRMDELDDEPTTNPGAAVDVEYLKRKLGELEKGVEGALAAHDNKLTFRSVVVAVFAVGASVITAILFIDNRVQAQTDAGVRVEASRLTALEQTSSADRAQNDVRFRRIEEGQLRTDKKLDALLDRLNVQNPAPTPIDGGR